VLGHVKTAFVEMTATLSPSIADELINERMKIARHEYMVFIKLPLAMAMPVNFANEPAISCLGDA
jgi:hypothetical protein